MKKLLPILTLWALCYNNFGYAQTPTTTTPAAPQKAAVAPQLTTEQQVQQIAGWIHSCATAKPILGWKNLTVSLDHFNQQLVVVGYATTGNNQIKKLELCDKQGIAQALIDLLNITTQGKPSIQWQSLLFRSQPNRQFEFTPLTVEDINKLAVSAKSNGATQ